MERTREFITSVFRDSLYPATLIVIFFSIVVMLLGIVMQGKGMGRLQRATGAILPFVVLVFLVVLSTQETDQAASFFASLLPAWRFLIGVGLGLLLMESGKLFLRSKRDAAHSLYSLFLAILGAFLLWSLMEGVLSALNLMLLGLVLSGGLDVVFRGPPRFSNNEG